MASPPDSVGSVIRWALVSDVGPTGDGERVDELRSGPGWRLERIVSHGHTAPADPSAWYDQDEDEWVMVVSGAARIRLLDPDSEIALGPGDAVWLPAHRRHRVTWTDPEQETVWVALLASPD